jgi:CheY-like chemotaxis protein
VQLRSSPGCGTTFEMYVPRAEPGAVEAEPRVPPRALERRSGTILLAEDEAHVRSVTERILVRYGYTVLAAENGTEALRMLDERSEPIDLLITDVVMPEIGGREVAERARERFPDIRVLLMSGYPGDAGPDAADGESGTAFIQKPFSPDALVRRVQEVLGPVAAG